MRQQTEQDVPVWHLSRYGEDEPRPRRRLTRHHFGVLVLAFVVAVYGGAMVGAALFTR